MSCQWRQAVHSVGDTWSALQCGGVLFVLKILVRDRERGKRGNELLLLPWPCLTQHQRFRST